MALDIVQEIKLRTDLVALVSAYVPLKRSGRSHKGLCPFHGEKTPSFHVDGERGFYKCYGCGAGGDCFSFIQQIEGLGFSEAGELLARKVGLEWERKGDTTETRSQRQRLLDLCALAERFFREQLAAAPVVQSYLERRGLTRETIEQFRLGYAPPGYESLLRYLRENRISLEDAVEADVIVRGDRGLRDRFVDRVIFPIFDLEGRPVAFGGRGLQPDAVPKYLNSRETPIFQKGRTLYGLHRAKKAIPEAGFAVAVEGYMDLIALHQAGIENAVASLGTAITETHARILKRYGDRLELVLCFDGDSAGLRAALRSSGTFEAAGCEVRVARLPEGEDPDTYIQRHGADRFRALLTAAEPILDYQLNRLRESHDLSSPGARFAFVREAARIISQSGSHLTRQEYGAKLTDVIDRLSDEWYRDDPPRALQARLSLRQEVNRLLRLGGAQAGQAPGRRAGAGPWSNGASAAVRPGPGGVPGTPASEPGSGPSVQDRWERYVLRAALTEYRWAERVQGRLTPAHFADSTLAGVAEGLFGNNGDSRGGGFAPLEQRREQVRTDPGNAAVLSELLLDEAPLSDEGLENCLEALERAWKARRIAELRRAQEEGSLTGDDPRREELVRLLGELGGRRRED